jgi:hypothetical protein
MYSGTIKGEGHAVLIFDVFILVSCCVFAVYFINSLRTDHDTQAMLLGFIMPVFFLLTAKATFFDIVFYVRFYGLRMNFLDYELVLSVKNREYRIPAGKDTKVIYCMFGYLITWPSGNKTDMILLRKQFFLSTRLRELREYFHRKMKYVSDPIEKKELLKSLHVNVFNPLKYMKFPTGANEGK